MEGQGLGKTIKRFKEQEVVEGHDRLLKGHGTQKNERDYIKAAEAFHNM